LEELIACDIVHIEHGRNLQGKTTMSDLMLDVGQANELKLAFRKAKYTNDDIKKLCEGSTLSDVRSVIRGHADVKILRNVIDLHEAPFIPDGWKVEQHLRGDSFVWDPTKVCLYLSKPQRQRKFIKGNWLRECLAGKPALNANVLDYLLAHAHLIPEEWKTDEKGGVQSVFFWGTIYQRLNGDLCVRCLYWGGQGWLWSFDVLANHWRIDNPAALRAS
jgi:hypothetical protein